MHAPVRVGLIADPQVRVAPALLADEPQWNGSTRRYGAVLDHVKSAVERFRALQVDWVVQLGDLIDGRNARESCSAQALAAVEQVLSGAHPLGSERVHHVIGNNDVINFSRLEGAQFEWARRARRVVGGELPATDGQPYVHYYEFKPCDSPWRFIVLDSFVVSLLPSAECNEDEAKAMLRAKSVGCGGLASTASGEEFRRAMFGAAYDALPPGDARRRFTYGNGGFGRDQLTWLRGVLERARCGGERVLIFAHNPTHPRVVNDPDGLAYDFEECLALLAEFSECVVAYIAGHDHLGGYTLDAASQVHHLTVPSPLEAAPATGSRFLILELHADHVHLSGAACVADSPVQRPFEHESDVEGGKRRRLQAQTTHRYLDFANHWGVVWPAKV